MPSCTSADSGVPFAATVMTSRLPSSREDCPKERYCDEVAKGRPECPPGRCRYGGAEHAKDPCPDHDRPFGLDVAEGGAATTTKPTKPGKPKKPARRPKKKAAGRRKVTARKAPSRKAPKRTKKKKATKKTRR